MQTDQQQLDIGSLKRLNATTMHFLALSLLTILARFSQARRAILQEAMAPSGAADVSDYTWHVTVGSRAPDCFQRDVILVNGDFQPTLEVKQGDFLKVNSISTGSRHGYSSSRCSIDMALQRLNS